jgi:hypothetical protein
MTLTVCVWGSTDGLVLRCALTYRRQVGRRVRSSTVDPESMRAYIENAGSLLIADTSNLRLEMC